MKPSYGFETFWIFVCFHPLSMFYKVFIVTINDAGEFSYFYSSIYMTIWKTWPKLSFSCIFFLFLQKHTQLLFAAKLFYDVLLMQCYIFEMLAFPRNEEKYWNIRKNWKAGWFVNIKCDNVAKQTTWFATFFFLIFFVNVLYKLSTMCVTFQGHNYSQSEMK